MAKKNRAIRYLIPVLVVLILAVWYGVSRYRGVGGLPLRTEETKNFIAEVKDICGGSVKVQYGFPQRVEITLAAPVGPDSVSVQLRTDDAELPHSYYSGYPFERWSGPSQS